ncbi:unnamed protein product [Ilex paraguariensis]|uniref:Uncharacterized protein n=1 Tax=Ilex paraguariensis TaxID=185542 RepID=A0ABC8TAF9_9AQUA
MDSFHQLQLQLQMHQAGRIYAYEVHIIYKASYNKLFNRIAIANPLKKLTHLEKGIQHHSVLPTVYQKTNHKFTRQNEEAKENPLALFDVIVICY